MPCPACKKGKMTFSKRRSLWMCEDCRYHFSEEYFLDGCVFWFCDECDAFLNNQEGFDGRASKHVCRNCGYENDTSADNIKGVCSDCGKTLPNPDATLCADCRQARREKAKELFAVGTGVAVVIGAAALAATASDNSSDGYNANIGYSSWDDSNGDDSDKEKINTDTGHTKYKVIFDDEEQDEIFDTEEDAEEYALYLCSCSRFGAETLNMSNPGDYEYDEDTFEIPEYKIIEIDC